MDRLFLGPMSNMTIHSGLGFNQVGFIPSRRQIDYDSGYVGYTTQQFRALVGNRCTIERDHGGPMQGSSPYSISFQHDSEYFDIIHIDPWKSVRTFEEGITRTIELIKYCYALNWNLKFEVGTEESIWPFSLRNYEYFLKNLSICLSIGEFNSIKYVVTQSGVKLDLVHKRNLGQLDLSRLKTQCNIIHNYGFLTKEHNGDYLSTADINRRFVAGMDAINIAPEFGQIETQTIMNLMTTSDIWAWSDICKEHIASWEKWGRPKSDWDLVAMAGHYTFNDPKFQRIRNGIYGIDMKVKECMENRIKSILQAFQ